jgi:hypothetical protein
MPFGSKRFFYPEGIFLGILGFHHHIPLSLGDCVAINENLLLLQHGTGGRVMKL